jgi:DNA-binding CsgD family transcriptional regulator
VAGFLLAPVTRRTWGELGYAVAGLPLAVAGFAVTCATLFFGLTFAVTFVGLPLLAAGSAGSRWLGRADRAMARRLLGMHVAEPAPLRRRPAALARVAAGGTALDPEVVTQLLGASRRAGPLASLTPREREVLGLMAEGRSNAGISGNLVISERAVEKHVGNIFSKLGLPPAGADHRRVLAVLRYLES